MGKVLQLLFSGIDKDDDTPVAISKGYAVFDAATDKSYQDAFERADHAMYEDKKAYYSKNNIDRRKT